jgi:hypothetical protein
MLLSLVCSTRTEDSFSSTIKEGDVTTLALNVIKLGGIEVIRDGRRGHVVVVVVVVVSCRNANTRRMMVLLLAENDSISPIQRDHWNNRKMIHT